MILVFSKFLVSSKFPSSKEDSFLSSRSRPVLRPPFLGAGVHSIVNFYTSRYRDDFRQISRVGYGAYGSVFKVSRVGYGA